MLIVYLVFFFVYAGLLVGRLPGLRLDRSGIVLLGAIVLLATGAVDEKRAFAAVDIPTITLLFGLMIVSAQLQLSGFYMRILQWLASVRLGPAGLLGILVFFIGGLAAIFINDIICLAAVPIIIDLSEKRRLNPVPFLLGLACAANIGSAATLIGNPQNILIGQVKGLAFSGYLREAGPLVFASLLITWGTISFQYRHFWENRRAGCVSHDSEGAACTPFDLWKTCKGLLVALGIVVLFLISPWPRDLIALAGAGLLLTSRKLYSREILNLVDWQLLVMFIGLFIINDAFQLTGLPEDLVSEMARAGIHLSNPGWFTLTTVVLSNAVSNVPAVMLLLPLTTSQQSGIIMAVASTFAGNLLVVGSIANVIVVEGAARRGVWIDWRSHFKIGLPVTAMTTLFALLYFTLTGLT